MTDTSLIETNVDPDVSAAMVVYERLNPLKDALGLDKLTVPEMQLFAMVAHHTGLDPFTKQIYAIKRGGKVTHQTGIDGYRSTAERTKEYAGSDETTFEECDCASADSPPRHPAIARTVIHRILPNGHVVNQVGVARWHELKPDHRKPQGAYDFLDQMWWDMPWNQLSKCSEANGLRKAFPRVLGGVYIAEEMAQADVTEGQAREVGATAAERVAARRAELEAGADEESASASSVTEAVADDTRNVKPASVQGAPAPVDSGSAPAATASVTAEQFTRWCAANTIGRSDVAKAVRDLGLEGQSLDGEYERLMKFLEPSHV